MRKLIKFFDHPGWAIFFGLMLAWWIIMLIEYSKA